MSVAAHEQPVASTSTSGNGTVSRRVHKWKKEDLAFLADEFSKAPNPSFERCSQIAAAVQTEGTNANHVATYFTNQRTKRTKERRIQERARAEVALALSRSPSILSRDPDVAEEEILFESLVPQLPKLRQLYATHVETPNNDTDEVAATRWAKYLPFTTPLEQTVNNIQTWLQWKRDRTTERTSTPLSTPSFGRPQARAHLPTPLSTSPEPKPEIYSPLATTKRELSPFPNHLPYQGLPPPSPSQSTANSPIIPAKRNLPFSEDGPAARPFRPSLSLDISSPLMPYSMPPEFFSTSPASATFFSPSIPPSTVPNSSKPSSTPASRPIDSFKAFVRKKYPNGPPRAVPNVDTMSGKDVNAAFDNMGNESRAILARLRQLEGG